MALKNVLLTLLSREPHTGYDIVKSFDSTVSYVWSASHQQVYRELTKLTEGGLVRFTTIQQGDKPDKKIYHLTAAGKRQLRAWLEEPVNEAANKNLLLVKLLNLDRSNVGLMIAELDQKRSLAIEQLKTYEAIQTQHYQPDTIKKLAFKDLALYLALRKGISSIESHIDWLQEARNIIAQH